MPLPGGRPPSTPALCQQLTRLLTLQISVSQRAVRVTQRAYSFLTQPDVGHLSVCWASQYLIPFCCQEASRGEAGPQCDNPPTC